MTRLVLDDRLRNPWGILHGGAVAMLADEAACRAAATVPGASGPNGVAAADAVLHYLRPVKVGPVEARCSVLGTTTGRTVGAGGDPRPRVRRAHDESRDHDRLAV